MNYDEIKANLNLYAVLKNLEELVVYDSEAKELIKDWDITLQFSIFSGPKAFITFKDGKCLVEKGKYKGPMLELFFIGVRHFNKMMDGKAIPIPLRGISKIKFLIKDFKKITDRLEYYLKPTDDLLKNPDYLELNTRLTLSTALFAAKELATIDPLGKIISAGMRQGNILLKILPEGPSAYLKIGKDKIEAGRGEIEKPMAEMIIKDVKTANDFFNMKEDTFSLIGLGKVLVKGQIPMLDSMGLIIDRIPLYLK
ncbi:MAG: hypothetical protein HQK76_02610 [Desulfobacterales bacterium]|nr:hypothetical protein [Desulfobacterales bacterium]